VTKQIISCYDASQGVQSMEGEIGIHIERKFQSHIDEEWARKLAQNVLRAESITPPYEMSLVFTDSETVQRLNRDYRGVDESTDVLAFYMLPQHGADADFVSPPDDITHLGEVIISYPKAVEQAKEQGHSTEQELILLIIHGILHLLGYDHEKPEEEAKMKAREKELVERAIST
jgi:probable rRNA maturation factor